jgi:hypothetical protein
LVRRKIRQKDGMWLIDDAGKQMQSAPVSDAAKKDLERWFSGKAAAEAKFDRPVYEGDAASRALDTMSLEQHYIEHFGVSREFVHEFLSPVDGGGVASAPTPFQRSQIMRRTYFIRLTTDQANRQYRCSPAAIRRLHG